MNTHSIELDGSYSKNHSGEELSHFLLESVKNWKLTNKIISITTDNAPNIVKAAVKFSEVLKKDDHIVEHIRCLAHILHLIVNKKIFNESAECASNKENEQGLKLTEQEKNAVKEFQDLVKQCRSLTNKFNHSSPLNYNLTKSQMILKTKILKQRTQNQKFY